MCGADEVEVHDGGVLGLLDLDGERMDLADARPRPVKEAIVTMGGVALSEIDPETMEARAVIYSLIGGSGTRRRGVGGAGSRGRTGGYRLRAQRRCGSRRGEKDYWLMVLG